MYIDYLFFQKEEWGYHNADGIVSVRDIVRESARD